MEKTENKKNRIEKQVRLLSEEEISTCDKCNRRAEVKHYNFTYCKGCYIKIIYKRIKKEMRGKLKEYRTYSVDNKELKKILEKIYNFKFEVKDDAEIISETLDDENEEYINFLFYNGSMSYEKERNEKNPRPLKKITPKIKPLRKITNDEVNLLLEITHKINTRKEEKRTKLDYLDNKFGGIKFTFHKNMETLIEYFQKNP